MVTSRYVNSLYSNIPIKLAKEIITKKWKQLQKHTTLNLKNFLEVMELTPKYFEFNDLFLNKNSVVLWEELEETVIKQNNLDLSSFFRYVDDCITLTRPGIEKQILELFNNCHEKLQFTLNSYQTQQKDINQTLHQTDMVRRIFL